MSKFDFEQLVETDDPELEVRGSLELANDSASSGHVNLSFKDDTNSSTLREVHNHPLGDVSSSKTEKSGKDTSTPTSYPVMYNTGTGNSKVVREEVIIKQPNGENVINTRQTSCQNAPERWRDIERRRPLRLKHIRFLKVFSIVSVILFFPLGIPAVYFAFQLQREFDEGIMRGDIDKAQSLRKRVERLIIFAFLFALLVAVLVFALVERSLMTNDDPAANAMRNRVLPTG
ncbi:hypothetical protein FSP39_024288 [Pinctada imbricata]|uniref:Uncharacterized protein n=1 Tax=Pinctada imbricata TaxID=66713 RepID=A0AA88YNF4_PINIB|nr:hypothetical protein FSP39_024288 [Pinctada imbricata]